MKISRQIGSAIKYDTFGAMALANFMICVVSGIYLAIPFDIAHPNESIIRILLTNPAGSFFRNAHYWSAQLFLVFTLLHTWDFLNDNKSKKVKKGVWIRLVMSLVFVFYVMISGFILKADADSLQARRIIDSLIGGIPFIGHLLSYSFIGPEGDFQLLYVHHIATATIFLVIITLEHTRTIWSAGRTFLITMLLISALSFFFRAPIHDNLNPVVKGPWYFLGLQEILHWMSHPDWVLVIMLAVLLLVYYLPVLRGRIHSLLSKVLLYIFIAYMALTTVAYFFRGEDWIWDWKMQDVFMPFVPMPVDFGKIDDSLLSHLHVSENMPEGCITCHGGMKGFSIAHNPSAIGCASCHLGDPFTLDKDFAHRSMVRIPGNLTDASRTCGTSECHPDITQRIKKTLMTTLSGVVSVDRFVFNESALPGKLSNINSIGHSAADQHLRDLCANCHLGNPKTEYGPVNQLSRGGGCNACHLNYATEALSEFRKSDKSNYSDTILQYHPELSLKISNDHCFGCHSRSGRIAPNYEGWHETQLAEDEVTNWEGYRLLEDQRVFEFVAEDVHHAAGMDCIDCHNSYETMGDGRDYIHEEFQVKIMCEDCHFTGKPNTVSLGETDAETYKIIQLRDFPDDREYLKKKKTGKALVNTFVDDFKKPWLITKNSGKVLPMLPPAAVCTEGNAHTDLSCDACHTAWAPQCIGCHNTWEGQSEGYDLLENKYKQGTWVEFTGKFFPDPPVLGVDERVATAFPGKRKIATFVPGMVLSIDPDGYKNSSKDQETIFHRLYAPVAAHTTMKAGRSCKSCHNDPLALGYGRGSLDYMIDGNTGRWVFTPRFAANKYDGLPEDAWTGFLLQRDGDFATREGVRPFNVEEQKAILTVGACLTCHEEDSPVMIESLNNFDLLLKKLTNRCVLPGWQE
nr:hypothetical protein [Bacteroidota bacterium]